MPQVYRLLTGPDDSNFCHKVTKALSQGWQLHGSPTLSYRRHTRLNYLRAGSDEGNGIGL